MWYVYILECVDGTFYTGITKDLARRVAEHNESSLGAKYTRMRRPVKLVYSCKRLNRAEATREELRIKKSSRAKKRELIILGRT